MNGAVITHNGRGFTPDGTSTLPSVCDCEHAPLADGIVGGYAVMPDGRTLCNDCATAAEIATFNEPTTERAFAYLSDGGDGPRFLGSFIAQARGHRTAEPGSVRLTTWTGAELATVTSARIEKRCTPSGGRYDVVYFRATDALGRRWYGTSPGLGMYARMRRAKGAS